ncbi:MAG TPA: phage holin family protein [Kineosporiaceae bacterium]|jgi:putative membrane protein|nr:phage holin family protein [Kineosporiaceae bacterium]
MSSTTTERRPGLLVSALVHFVAEAIAIWVATLLISGIHVYGGALTYLWIGVLFGVVNAVLGSILRLFTLPLVVLTLGLFSLIISTAMLALTAALSSKLDIDGFWSALGAALIVAVVSALIEMFTRRTLTA